MISVYSPLVRVALLEALQYRFSLIIWLLGRVIQPVVYLAVWNAVARARGGEVGGFTSADFAAYYILITLIDLWTNSGGTFRFPDSIRTGTLSQHLLKPLHPLHRELASILGYRLVDTLIMLPALALLCLWFDPRFTVTSGSMLLSIPVILLAGGIRFMVEMIVGFPAFWFTRVSAFMQTYYLLLFFFSGQAAPNTLLPGSLQAVSLFLPFQWMLQFPVDVLLGRLATSEILRGFAFQMGWFVLCALLMRLIWKKGLKAYTAVGS